MASTPAAALVRQFSTARRCELGALERWFRPCPKACCCPRHNPASAPPRHCGPCAKKRRAAMDWTRRCIFVKNPCFRHHGEECTCHACAACRDAHDFECNLAQIHDDGCDCALCMEPHDHGCRCAACASHGAILRSLSASDATPAKCACGGCDAARTVRSETDQRRELERKVLQLGEHCYCLLHHPPDCACAGCVECRAKLAQDARNEKREARRHRQLAKMLSEQAAAHGACCHCLQCEALRLRIEMTMCHAHLEVCRCANDQGAACMWCGVCRECMRRKRTATMLKAEDYW